MAVAGVIQKPRRPGTRTEFVGQALPTVTPSIAETVAIPITHDWGPENEVNLVTSFAEFQQLYGDSTGAGMTAIYQAFKGQGVGGAGGAGGIQVYRMAVAGDGDYAVKTLNNTTPVAAITLTAIYKGTRGNRLTVTTQDDPLDAANDLLILLFDGAEVERYKYANTNITDLAAQINARSQWVTAGSVTSGTALAVVSASAFAGGDDGTTLTGTEWTAAMSALEFKRFSIFAPFHLTDATIRASLVAWAQAQDQANKPVMLVVGGAAAESLSTALTRASGIKDPNVVTVGIGTYHDSDLDADLSTSELAPRVAGVLAARGIKASLTFAKLGDLDVVGDTGPSNDEIISAIEGGVIPISQTSALDAAVRLEKGVTTYSVETGDDKPLDVFGDARLVRALHRFLADVREWGDDIVIGNVPVNDDTRDAVGNFVGSYLRGWEEDGIITPDQFGDAWSLNILTPTDPAWEDTIPFEFIVHFAKTANNILGRGQVR